MQRRTNFKNKLFTKAFALRLADDSQGVRTYTEDGESFTDVRDSLLFLESAIHTLAQSGNRDGLRRALKQYALTAIRLTRGVL